MSKVGIIAALPDEASLLFSSTIQPLVPVEITNDVYLCLAGVGYNNALAAGAALIKQGATALISWGVAGGINEELHSGDLVIAKQVISGDDCFDCDQEWQDRLLVQFSSTTFRVFNSAIYSDDKMYAKPADKRRLFDKSGADAIDMESAALAELSAKMNVDFIVIRSIADEAVATLPTAVTRHTDQLGRPKPIRFALSCLFNPGQIPALLLLARAYRKALLTLDTIAPDLKAHHFLYNTPA